MNVRRVVTGFNGDGAAVIVSDQRMNEQKIGGGSKVTPIWAYGDEVSFEAPDRLANGYDSTFDTNAMALNWGVFELAPGEKLAMHRTSTVDLITVLEGEVTCVLDSGAVTTLKQHEVLLQRGVTHQWENRGDVPCAWTFATIGRLEK